MWLGLHDCETAALRTLLRYLDCESVASTTPTMVPVISATPLQCKNCSGYSFLSTVPLQCKNCSGYSFLSTVPLQCKNYAPINVMPPNGAIVS